MTGHHGVKFLTAAELQAMPSDQLDAEAYRSLIGRQRRALAALTAGDCTPVCLAAVDRWGDCECICRGRFHADLWGTDVIAWGDWGDTTAEEVAP